MVGWLEKLEIRQSQLSTELKLNLKLKLSLAIEGWGVTVGQDFGIVFVRVKGFRCYSCKGQRGYEDLKIVFISIFS